MWQRLVLIPQPIIFTLVLYSQGLPVVALGTFQFLAVCSTYTGSVQGFGANLPL